MSAVLRIARREVRERQVLLWAALGLGLLTLLLLVLPETGGAYGFGELLGLLLFLAYPAAAALAVGSSLLGRDLALGRLSFYFSRPLSAGTLWAGKFLGGVTLVVGAFLGCSAPWFLFDKKAPDPGAAGIVLLALLCLMGLAHVLTAMYRSGSRLFALDLGLGALFVIALVALVRHLQGAGAGRALWGSGPTEGVVPMALAAATLAILAAAAVQLAHGRGDAHRGHIGLSVAIWSFALVALVASSLWGRWLLGVTPADAGGVGHPLFAAPRGNALFFPGSSRHGRAGFSPVFLMDGESGSYIRLPPEGVTPPAFSGDGRMAAWVAPEIPWWAYAHDAPLEVAPLDPVLARVLGVGPNTLAVARLDRGAPLIEGRPVALPDGVSRALALDGDGRRVLVSGPSSAHLLDTDRGNVLASVPLSEVLAAEFLSDGAVRFYQREASPRGGAALVVLDWRPQDGSRVERARMPGHARMLLLARRGDLCVVSTGAMGKAILDARSGGVSSFESDAADMPGAALVLSTGQVALSLGPEVRIVDRNGKTGAAVPVEPGTQVYALREPQPGVLAVGLWALSVAKRRTVFVDASTGAVRREEREILPAGPRGGRLAPPEAGSLASRLFMDLDGALIAFEADGRRRVIVAARE